MIGNEYLESVREMVSKGREKRKNKSQDLSMEASVKKKKVDYLEWLKQERKNQTSGKKVNKRAYLDNNNMSYEQKLNRVLAESLKLSEDTKLKEQKLKYGKFKTAEQILAHKWQIDKNYIDMANMKLKLIQ